MNSPALTLRRASRRRLSLRDRDAIGLNALHRTELRVARETVAALVDLLAEVAKHPVLWPLERKIKAEIANQYLLIAEIVIVERPVRPLRTRDGPMTFDRMQATMQQLGIGCSEYFRFQSFDHLRRLLDGFRFPRGEIRVGKGYVTNAEEILLISLSRLSFPHRWNDLKERFPSKDRWHLQACFYWFLDFLIDNWGYLLLNNLQWWKPRLAASSEAIRIKLQNLNHAEWRQYHPPADQPNGFRVCSFIDNTLIAMCRPGGVMTDGPAGPRVPFEVQQALCVPPHSSPPSTPSTPSLLVI